MFGGDPAARIGDLHDHVRAFLQFLFRFGTRTTDACRIRQSRSHPNPAVPVADIASTALTIKFISACRI